MSLKPLDREFLLSRGYCCHSGCQNCPYEDEVDPSTPQELCGGEPNRNLEEEAEKYLQELD